MDKSRSTIIHVIIPVALSIAGLLSTLLIVQLLQKGILPTWKVFNNDEINFTFTMQVLVLVNSLIVLAIMYLYDRERFALFFRAGDMKSWAANGIVIAAAFTLGTAMMMGANVLAQGGNANARFLSLLPLVVLFAATNAWSEEIFSRFVIVAGLHGKLPAVTISTISAVLFGLAHYGGTPGGIFGVIAAGTMGWFLARSVIETTGMGWALLIHFLQDLVIFGSGAMVIAGSSQ